MIKVAQEGQIAKEEKGVQDIRAETNHHARKFYAQRNCESVEWLRRSGLSSRSRPGLELEEWKQENQADYHI
jgi:hypothetical protein